MSIKDSFETCVFKKYADFKGFASQSEFWPFYIIYIVCLMFLPFFGFIIGDAGMKLTSYFLMTLWVIIAIGLLCPLLAVSFRRLRDTNLSPWNILWILLPFVGCFIYWILMARPTQRPLPPIPTAVR